MSAKQKLKVWGWGLVSALVSGAGSGATIVAGAMTLSSQTFNVDSDYNLGLTLKLFGIASVVGAVIGLANYLKQSPLPKLED